MLAALSAFSRAARDLTHPRIIAVMFVPMLGALLGWTAVAWYFWGTWTRAIASFLSDTAVARWFASYGFSWMLEGVSAIAVFALLIAAVLITAMIITEFLAMPVIVSVVERRYASLEKERSATVIGSIGNAAGAIAIFIALWLVTLPLWLTGIGAVVVPTVLSAYLNQRFFRYDALGEHAGREEYRTLVRESRGRLFTLGLMLAVVYYIPLVNLIAPVLSGLAFTHLCLAELERLRRRGT